MSDEMLSIEGLRVEAVTPNGSASSSGQPLVDDITLSLARGEVLGLIGESGAGKTTIGLAAMGYARPGCRVTSGRVIFESHDLATLSSGQLRALRGSRIAYVAQSAAASLNPAIPLGTQVAETMVMHQSAGWRAAREKAARLFSELDLPSPETFGARYPHQVSGGQLQRAMIAMAMMCEPELLVLDEPTTALDVTTQIEVLAAIRQMLRRRGTAALYISHDLALVAQLADRIAVLQSGRLVESGATEKVLRHPREPYTRQLLAARRRWEPASVGENQDGRQPILALTSVSASYRAMPGVLREISFSLFPGETLALVGTSGSGKSTLARLICGLLPPTEGTVALGGKILPGNFVRRDREQLRRVQMIYQLPDTALNPRQSVGRIIGRVVRFYFGVDRKSVNRRVSELLDMVGLPREFARRRPSQLSGGQKQRVGIARALAAEPDVIVCDEVTSALDPLVADDILALLRDLQRSGRAAYIFITHDIEVVRRVATHVMVMSQGRIVDKGTLREVFAPPLHPDTETLLRSVPELRTDWLTDVLAGRDNIAGPTATSLAHAGQDPFASASAARVPIKTRREGE